MSRGSDRSPWVWAWVAWLIAFLAIELPAAHGERKHDVRTLSHTVWLRWAPRWWQRLVFIVFGFEVFVLHFADAGAHWWSGGWAVAATGLPVAALIAWRERDMWRKILGGLKAVGSKLKSAGSWTLRRGPLVSSLLTGAALAFPAAAPVLTTLGGILAGTTGGAAAADPAVGKAFAELVAGGLLFIGALRKFWSLARPMLAPKA